MANVILSTRENYANYLKSQMHGRLQSQNSFNDSTINFLSDIISQAVSQNRSELTDIYNSNLLSRANGTNLETLAYNKFGLLRKPGTYNTSYKEEKNVLFYVKSTSDNPTFGSINNGENIVIPKGTLIGNSSAFDSTSNAVYMVFNDVILLSTSSIQYVDVIAMNSGISSAVSQNTLVHHNFNSYFDNQSNTLAITNRFPIINGSDPESDESLRSRCIHFVDSQRTGSLDSITASALNVPGILNVSIIPGYYGIGTTAVICKGADQESSIRLISDVQKSLDTINIPGGNFYAISPVYIKLNLSLLLSLPSNLPSNSIESLKSLIKSEIFNFCRNNTSSLVNLNTLSETLIRKIRSQNVEASLKINNDNQSVFFTSTITKANVFPETNSNEEPLTSLIFSIKLDEVLDIGSINIDVIQG